MQELKLSHWTATGGTPYARTGLCGPVSCAGGLL